KYSIRIYKLIREADKHLGKVMPNIRHTPEKHVELTSATKSYNWSQIKQNEIDKAIDEINLKIIDLNLDLLIKIRCRKVDKVDIYNTFYPRKQSTEYPVTMTNWLNN